MASKIGIKEQTVSELTKAVLKVTRPEEIILVDPLIRDEHRAGKDDMLGFGLEYQMALLAPTLIEFLTHAVDGSLKKLAEELGAYFTEKVSLRTHPKPDPNKLALIRRDLIDRLLARGFKSEDANGIGDSLVSVIVESPDLLRGLLT